MKKKPFAQLTQKEWLKVVCTILDVRDTLQMELGGQYPAQVKILAQAHKLLLKVRV